MDNAKIQIASHTTDIEKMAVKPLDHAHQADHFVQNRERARWHDSALWFVRQKRDRQVSMIPEWEELREKASQIKAYTLNHLADLLEEFERQAVQSGAIVHWAASAEEHNQIVYRILQKHQVCRVVKSKSMLTEECHLNPYLEAQGLQVVDTDLGEWIVQLREESPSHIVLPAIHIKKEEVGETFHQHIGTPKGTSDPTFLARSARTHLRQKFIGAEAGITGVNFAVAENGSIIICTNEGNADLGVSLPRLHIACMGIEKLIPRLEDLAVFTRLLARSATGQPITTYTSHFRGPLPGGELHIVIVDNGRSNLRESKEFHRSLHCIRCGACMNTCPVFRRSGGHSYGTTIPGPIGSILGPAMDPEKHSSLPYACTLCGSCTDVCPVKIDLHHQLLTWRGELAKERRIPVTKRWSMAMASVVLRNTWLYRIAGWLGRNALRYLPRFVIYNRWNVWGRSRDLPPPPKASFRAAYRRRKRNPSQRNPSP